MGRAVLVHGGGLHQSRTARDAYRDGAGSGERQQRCEGLAVRECLNCLDGDSTFGRLWLVGLETHVTPAVTHRHDGRLMQSGGVEHGVVGTSQFRDDRRTLDQVLGARLDECGDVPALAVRQLVEPPADRAGRAGRQQAPADGPE